MRVPWRCAACYMPVRLDFMRNVLVCDVCGTELTVQKIATRGRWRILWDKLTGIDERR